MHETVLGPGVETHPPHTHAHQEIIILVEGTVQVTMDGRSDTVEAGSVIFYDPDKPHNLRNTGGDTGTVLRGRTEREERLRASGRSAMIPAHGSAVVAAGGEDE